MATYFDQAPFSSGPLVGTLTFSSSLPISAIGLRGLANERGEFLMTTLPVSPLSTGFGGTVLTFPHLASGGSWNTQVVLINPTDTVLTGAFRFYGQGWKNSGQSVKVLVNGVYGSVFGYSIPPRSVFQVTAQRSNQVGTVRLVPSTNTGVPSGIAILSYVNSQGITVSATGLPAQAAGSTFRICAEVTGTLGQAGSAQTGIAITNPSASQAVVQIEARNVDGTATGISTSITIPGGGQLAKFITGLLPQLPIPFKGVLRLTASSAINVSAVRGEYNERTDYLMPAIPSADEAILPSGPEVDVPLVIGTAGYTTQLILFSNTSTANSGKIADVNQNGETANQTLTPQP